MRYTRRFFPLSSLWTSRFKTQLRVPEMMPLRIPVSKKFYSSFHSLSLIPHNDSVIERDFIYIYVYSKPKIGRKWEIIEYQLIPYFQGPSSLRVAKYYFLDRSCSTIDPTDRNDSSDQNERFVRSRYIHTGDTIWYESASFQLWLRSLIFFSFSFFLYLIYLLSSWNNYVYLTTKTRERNIILARVLVEHLMPKQKTVN